MNRIGRKKIIIVFAVLALFAVIVSIGIGFFYHYYSMLNFYDHNAPFEILEEIEVILPEEDENDPDNIAEPASPEEIESIENNLVQNLEQMQEDSELYSVDAFNILAIGVDSRSDSYSGRSDAMILISINKKSKKVVMTSFLRDTYVSIPGYGSNRLNAAYAFGGEYLLTETFKANFGIEVDRCVTVNFYIVMDLVDAVGGVDIELTADVISVMNGYIGEMDRLLKEPEDTDKLEETLSGTSVHLNGKQALAYARVRYVGTDFARTGRQREIIMLCLEKIKKMSLAELDELAEEFLPRIRTDLTEGDCASLLLMALSISDYEFESFYIPMDGTWNSANIRGMSVLTVDFEANTKAWYERIQGENSF